MNGKQAHSRVQDRDAALKRHVAAVETRNLLQGLPQFRADHDLPERLRTLLRHLEQEQQPAVAKRA